MSKIKFKEIADAIREKDGTTEQIVANDFAARIRAISGSENLDAELNEQDSLLSALEQDINNLPSASGSESLRTYGKYFVRCIDYDGTVLKEEKLNSGDVFTLPEPPSHESLVFQSWSCSQEIVNNTITIADNNVMVGTVYGTQSGLSEFDIELTKITGLSVTLNLDGTKDWGDGTSDNLTEHTYMGYGKYTIKCDGKPFGTGWFGNKSSADNYSCVAIRLGTVSEINDAAFKYCASLTSITIPNSVTTIGYDSMAACYSLTCVIVPNSVTVMESRTFQFCYSLTNVVIPDSIESYANTYAFSDCHSLTNIALPNSLTNLDASVFRSCHSLSNIIIPNNVTGFGDYAFQNCYSLKNIGMPDNITNFGSRGVFNCCESLIDIVMPSGITDLSSLTFGNCFVLKTCDFSKNTSVPTLSNTNAFNKINGLTKIIVPDALYDEWIAATNWSTYADYIYKASEVV